MTDMPLKKDARNRKMQTTCIERGKIVEQRDAI